MGDRTWLDSSAGLNGFGCCVVCRKWLNLSLVDRFWFGFGLAVENDLSSASSASGSKLTGFLCRGIEIDLILKWGSKLTWFQWWVELHLFFFMCRIEIDLVLESGSNLTCFLCGGQNRLRFCVRAENCLGLIYGSTLTWFLERGSKLNWFSCADIIDLFLVWGAIDLVFARVVEIDLVFECWPKITFFYCEHLTWLHFSVHGRN